MVRPLRARRITAHRFQFKECAQQLIRLNDIAFTIVFVCINNPAPTIARDSTAIAPRPTGSVTLSAMISQYFIGDMMSGELTLCNRGEHSGFGSRSAVNSSCGPWKYSKLPAHPTCSFDGPC